MKNTWFSDESDIDIIDKLSLLLSEHEEQAKEIAHNFYDLMLKDTDSAIKKTREFIEKARNIGSDRAFVEAVAGGPDQNMIAPVLNIFELVYPVLPKESRKIALYQIIDYLDFLNYFNAQDHVALIHEPWLVADIIVNRKLYWPGYKEYADLLEQKHTWEEFEPETLSAKSMFFLSYTLIHKKYGSKEIKENFCKKMSSLIDRTLDATAALICDRAQSEYKEKSVPINETIEKQLLKYDDAFHNTIREKIKEEKWINPDF